MLRIANYVFLPTLWFYPHNIFLSVLICFLARTVLRQKGNILYLYCNMLNPFISACFFFHCFYAAFNRNSNTFPSFLQKKKKSKKYTGFINGCLNITLRSTNTQHKSCGTFLKRRLLSGPFLKQRLPTFPKKLSD